MKNRVDVEELHISNIYNIDVTDKGIQLFENMSLHDPVTTEQEIKEINEAIPIKGDYIFVNIYPLKVIPSTIFITRATTIHINCFSRFNYRKYVDKMLPIFEGGGLGKGFFDEMKKDDNYKAVFDITGKRSKAFISFINDKKLFKIYFYIKQLGLNIDIKNLKLQKTDNTDITYENISEGDPVNKHLLKVFTKSELFLVRQFAKLITKVESGYLSYDTISEVWVTRGCLHNDEPSKSPDAYDYNDEIRIDILSTRLRGDESLLWPLTSSNIKGSSYCAYAVQVYYGPPKIVILPKIKDYKDEIYWKSLLTGFITYEKAVILRDTFDDIDPYNYYFKKILNIEDMDEQLKIIDNGFKKLKNNYDKFMVEYKKRKDKKPVRKYKERFHEILRTFKSNIVKVVLNSLGFNNNNYLEFNGLLRYYKQIYASKFSKGEYNFEDILKGKFEEKPVVMRPTYVEFTEKIQGEIKNIYKELKVTESESGGPSLELEEEPFTPKVKFNNIKKLSDKTKNMLNAIIKILKEYVIIKPIEFGRTIYIYKSTTTKHVEDDKYLAYQGAIKYTIDDFGTTKKWLTPKEGLLKLHKNKSPVMATIKVS